MLYEPSLSVKHALPYLYHMLLVSVISLYVSHSFDFISHSSVHGIGTAWSFTEIQRIYFYFITFRGRVDDFFRKLNFIALFTFLIKYYNIMFIIIVFWFGNDKSRFFFHARFPSFHTHASLLTFFVCCFILLHSCCSHAQVFGKTLVHEFPISYSHT